MRLRSSDWKSLSVELVGVPVGEGECFRGTGGVCLLGNASFSIDGLGVMTGGFSEAPSFGLPGSLSWSSGGKARAPFGELPPNFGEAGEGE